MKKSIILCIVILALTICSCSWISRFYLINKTEQKLIVSYSIKSTPENESFALEKSISFYPLNKQVEKEDRELIGEKQNGEFSKEVRNGIEFL